MKNINDLCVIICVSLGGISLSLLHRTDAVMFVLLAAAGVLFSFLCTLLIRRGKLPDHAFGGSKYILGISAVASSSVSAAIASALVTDTDVLDKKFLPLTVLLVLVFVLLFCFSSSNALPKTASVAVIASTAVLVILILLCLTETELSTVLAGGINYRYMLPLVAFTLCDTVYVLPLIKGRGKFTLTLGITISIAYMAAMTLIALSVLRDGLFYEFEMPVMKLWQSTFIAAFLNRFETIAICVFFILSAIKSGIILQSAFNVFGKSCFYPIAISFTTFTVAVLLFPWLTYFAAVLTVLCGFVFPTLAVLKK